MNNELTTVTEALADEIARYLAAVDLFRAEGREPTWRPELPSEARMPAAATHRQPRPSDVRLH